MSPDAPVVPTPAPKPGPAPANTTHSFTHVEDLNGTWDSGGQKKRNYGTERESTSTSASGSDSERWPLWVPSSFYSGTSDDGDLPFNDNSDDDEPWFSSNSTKTQILEQVLETPPLPPD